MKAAKINQKLPISNIVPNKETCAGEDMRAESKKAKAIKKPEANSHDFEKTILPSRNLAIAQKTIHTARPATKSNPFEASTGILAKGKQKRGNNITTKNNAKNESLSNIFELMSLIIL
jgi:hypothetical protein